MKYGIFLSLEKLDEKPIKNLKKKLLNKVIGKKTYFDHQIHLTLYCFNSKSNLNIIKKKFLNEINIKNQLNISVKTKKIFYNDPLTKLDTLVLETYKSKQLIGIQKKVFQTFKKFISKNPEKKLPNKTLNYNVSKYGYPFFGKIWIPHITLGSLDLKKNMDILEIFKSQNIRKKITIRKVTLNKILKDGKFREITSK